MTFEDFLRAEWCEDQRLYADDVRMKADDASLQRSYEIPSRVGDTPRGSAQERCLEEAPKDVFTCEIGSGTS